MSPYRFAIAAIGLIETPVGQFLAAPFLPFVHVITATEVTFHSMAWLVICFLMVAAAWTLTLQVDQHFHQAWLRRERSADVPRESLVRGAEHSACRLRGVRAIVRLGGAGPIAWRQWVSARKYLVSLLIALTVPAVLSWLPLASDLSPLSTFLNVVGALAFYSFLLLPAALKFDFRRDCDRLPILKTLPIHPSAVVIGQLATPIALATSLQLAVLAVTVVVRPVSPGLAVGAALFFIPINVMIFGLDNLIFLLYPHRMHQEGLQVFLRATLTFTAKGLLFGIALGIVYMWALSARTAAALPLVSLVSDHRIVFGMGLWGLAALTGLMLVCLLTWAFARYDPSLDMPAG